MLESSLKASVLLLAYNQEEYIKEALESFLKQECDPIEIIVSDDCSTDGTFRVIEEVAKQYKGSHRLVVNRTEKNLGVANHFSELVGRAGGDILIAAAGDDISLPSRVDSVLRAFNKYPEIQFYECALEEFDSKNTLRIYRVYGESRFITLEDFIKNPSTGLVGAGRAYRKNALLKYPSLEESCPSEDSPCLVRCLVVGCGLYEPVVLVKYRRHDSNLSSVVGVNSKKLALLGEQYSKDMMHIEKNGFLRFSKVKILKKVLDIHIEKRLILEEIRSEENPARRSFYWIKIFILKVHHYFLGSDFIFKVGDE